MPYNVELPDGTLVTDIPDDMPQDEVRRQIISAYPTLASKARTWGEALVTDPYAQLASGLGALVKFPGQMYGLATGDWDKTGSLGLGTRMEEYAQEKKSAGLKAREAEVAQKVEEAEKQGVGPAALAAIKGGLSDPALATGMLLEQLPGLAPSVLAAFLAPPASPAVAAAQAAARKAVGTAGEKAAIEALKAATAKAATQAAVVTGGVQAGAGAGENTYKIAYDNMIASGVAPEEAASRALTAAREAGVSNAVIMSLAQKLPGASAVEKAIARVPGEGGALAGLAKGAAGEALGMGAGMGGGKLAENVALAQQIPGYDLTTGVGGALGSGATVGALMGGTSGFTRSREAQRDVAQEAAQQRVLAAQAAREQAALERAQAEAAPKGYEGDQGLLFKPTKTKAETEKLPTDPAKLQDEFNALSQQEPTPETQDRMAKLARQYETVMAKKPEVEPVAPMEQLGLGLEGTRESADMYLEIARLKQQPQTAEVKNRVKELTQQIKQLNIDAITQGQEALAQRKREEQMAAESAFSPQPPARPVGYTAEGQGRMFTPAEMRESGLRRGEEKPVSEPTPTTPKQMERAGQRKLLFEAAAPKVETVGETGIIRDEAVPEPKLAPKYPAEFQPVMEKLTAAGVRPETQTWAQKANNHPFLRKLMNMAPEAAPEARKAFKLKEGTSKAEVFDALFPAPGVPEFKPAAGAGESRLGLSGQLGVIPPAAPAPRAGEPVGRGVVPAGRAAPAPAAPKVAAKPALEKPLPSSVRAEQYWKDTAEAVGGKTKPFAELTPAQRAAWREAVKLEDVANLRSEYERIVAEGPSKAEEIRAREQAKREAAEAKRVEQERAIAEKEAEAKRKAEAVAARERAKREAVKPDALWNKFNDNPDEGRFLPFKKLTKSRQRDWEAAVAAGTADIDAYKQIAGAQLEAERAREKAKLDAILESSVATSKRRMEESEAKRKTEEAEAKRKTEEAEAKRKAKEAEEAEAQRKLEALPPYEERVKLSADDLYPKLKDFDSAVAAIYDQASNPAERTIASLIKTRVKEFKKLGFTFSFRITPEGKMLSSGARGHSVITFSPIGEATKVAIALNHPSNEARSGTRWKIVTHELLHAITQAQIEFAPEGSTAKKLKSLFKDVVEYFNARSKTKTLTDFETRIYNGEINALKNPDELLTWGLTDKNMQDWLNGIESKKGNFLSRLYDVVANTLGLSKPNTALAELLSISETLLTEPTDAYVKSANLRGASFGRQENLSDVPNWALGFAEGLPVVWFEKDAALIKAESFTGKTIYLLATPEGVSQADVGSYTGKGLSPTRLAEVRAIADTFRAMPEEKTSFMKTGTDPLAPAKRSDIDQIASTSKLMEGKPSYLKTAFKDFLEVFTAAEGVDLLTRLRTRYVTRRATIADRLGPLFRGMPENEVVKLVNPEISMAQAEASANMVGQYVLDGAVVYDPKTTMHYTTRLKDVPSFSDVMQTLSTWAKGRDQSFERGKITASKVLEGMRLNDLVEQNKAGLKDIPIHKLSMDDPRTAEQQIAAAVAAFKADPKLAEIRDMMNKSRFHLLDDAVSAGWLSAEEAKLWKDVVNYVPFDRLQDLDEAFRSGKVKGRGLAQMQEVAKLVGTTTREVGDVFDNHLKTMAWILERNMAQRATINALRTLESLGYATYLGKSDTGAKYPVKTFIKGEAHYFDLPTRYDLMAFKDLTAPKNAVIRTAQAFSNVLRKTITAMPPFAIKQITDDLQRIYVNSGLKNPYAAMAHAVGNFAKIGGAALLGKEHPLVKPLARKGITGMVDFNPIDPADSVLKSLGYVKRGTFGELIHRLDAFTHATDIAVRTAIYDQTMKETKGDELLATTRAREFINFRNRGHSDLLNAVTATVPFFNAYLQAMDVLYRNATGKNSTMGLSTTVARRMFWSQVAKMGAFSAIYALAVSGTDDYESADLNTRNNNFLLPGTGRKIGVPNELAALYKVPVESLLEYVRRSGTPEEQEASEAAITALQYAFTQYSPVGGRVTPIPAAIKPLLEIMSNHSFTFGRALEGNYQQNLMPSERKTSQTSEAAMAISKFIETTFGGAQVSPIHIDTFLNGYFGSLSALITMTTDQLLNPDKVDRPLHQQYMIGQYTYKEVGTRKLDEFYDVASKVMPVQKTLKHLQDTDPEAAAKFVQEHVNELVLAQGVAQTQQELSKIRKFINQLNSPIGARMEPNKDAREKLITQMQQAEVQRVGWLREVRASLNKTKM